MTTLRNNFTEQLQKSTDQQATDYQQSIYQNIETSKIVYVSGYLFSIFYGIVAILCYFLYYEPTMSYKIKLVILALIVAYPFYIFYVEKIGYNLISYLYALISGNVYQSW